MVSATVRDDISVGDGGLAGRLHLYLDVVDHLVPIDGHEVWASILLPSEGRRVVEEDQVVTHLPWAMATNKLEHIDSLSGTL